MENIQAQNIMRITNDVEADESLEQIIEIRSESKRLEMIANARIENIQQQLNSKLKALGKQEETLIGQLRAYSSGLKMKESKTQKKYKLVTGELVIKKPTVKIEIIDREKLIQYVESSAQDYVKVKKDVDWADLKKVLDIDEDRIINKETGEVLGQLEGLEVHEVSEIFDVKL